jgi:hypothetical protein
MQSQLWDIGGSGKHEKSQFFRGRVTEEKVVYFDVLKLTVASKRSERTRNNDFWLFHARLSSWFLLHLADVSDQKSWFFREKMMEKKVFDFDVLQLAVASECSESIRFDDFEWIWASKTAVLQEKRNIELLENHQNEDFWQSSKSDVLSIITSF